MSPRVLYAHPLRWLDADPAPLAFADPALAEHPEARALLDQLNTARQWEAEAGRELRALQTDREALRAQVRALQDELAFAEEIEAADTSDRVWMEREAA